MRWNRWITIMSFAAAAAAAAFVLISAAPPKTAKATKPDRAKQLERGEYLCVISGCGDCHTPGTLYGNPDFSRKLSGSEIGWRGPWGVSYARNLTPDLETGMGYWTEDQIVNAFRTGQRPDGSVMLPPMPWQNLTRLTDEDAHALAAYLQSIPAISHEVPDRVPPDSSARGSVIWFPPPSKWDAPRTPPPAGETRK